LKILLATSRYPWPPRRGDQMRAVQLLDLLSSEHEVTLLTPKPGPGQSPPPADSRYNVELYRPAQGFSSLLGMGKALLENLPLQSGLFYQPDLGRKLRELAPRSDLAILQLVRLAVHLDDFGQVPLLVDLIDSLALNFAKRAEVDRPWLRPLLQFEARRLAQGERELAERAAGVILVCERDRQDLVSRLPVELAALAAKIAVVHLWVPEGSSQPAGKGEPVLAITGNLGYFVNVDAVIWWLEEVWPALRRIRPEIRVVVAGERPAARVRRAAKGAGVQLVESPADMGSILSRATLSLAPMRCGSGVPVKILEAWAAGIPVVATPWAAAGTSGREGEDFRIAGANPGEWVQAVQELLDDPLARQRLAENGRRRLAADYSREAVRRQLRSIPALHRPL
jgi:polysaccharide biosynthesis protein PslH